MGGFIHGNLNGDGLVVEESFVVGERLVFEGGLVGGSHIVI